MHKHWENPEVVGYGRLPARASFERLDESIVLLDGTWNFQRVAHPDAAPADWHTTATAGWHNVDVPSLWTMDPEVPEDNPVYTNVLMPFRNEPPQVPAENPTGLYKREILIADDWLKDRIVIYVGGVECCYYLYCNGAEVGFSKDSKLPAEFDLTKHLQAGTNTLALKVIRYSDSSYIEDQDQWWHAGIHRSIYLYRTPKVYIQDIFAKPAYDSKSGKGGLNVSVRLGDTNRNTLNHSIEVQLYAAADKPIWPNLLTGSVANKHFYAVRGQGPVIALTAKPRKMSPWTAETPNLYRLHVTLKDPDNNVLQRCSLKIGFRDIRIRNRELQVNGKAVLIKGVNRHDHDPNNGRVITEWELRRDINQMKQHNINAIRTSHYPNTEKFYELCDELGMYVVDEANLEAHHHYARLGAEPFWAGQFLTRGLRMVERDKNHPCIIMWSVGNETGFGPNHMAMTAWIREYDPSRPIHNENAICEQGVQDRWEENQHGSDVICPMYPSVDAIITHAKTSCDPRPLIMCEYAHAMGNSCGNLTEYWDAVETWHGLQGGFIWEWKDHGIKAEANGIEYWAYGGDFGEDRHDLNFVCDGLCWPDGTPHSSLLEYKKVIQPISVSRQGKKYRITNKHDHIDLKGYAVTWQLLANGEQVRAGRLQSFDTPPGYYEDFDFTPGQFDQNNEYVLTFEFRLKNPQPWAPKGHLVAWDQIILTKVRQKKSARGASPMLCSTEASMTTVQSDCSIVTFDESGLRSWTFNDHKIFDAAPELNFWRAPMDNDGIKGMPGQEGKALSQWQMAGLNAITWQHEVTGEQTCASEYLITQSSTGNCPGGIIEVSSQYTVTSAHILVRHQFSIPPTIPDLPRVGVRWQLSGSLEQLSWYGLGPSETYPDRKASGRLGVHQSTVTTQYVPYILPQEHGNLSDIRWIQLADPAFKLTVRAVGELQASASRYPHEMLTPAFHTYELSPDSSAWLSLDAAQRGVGGASCGPDTLDAYRVTPGQYELEYTLTAEAADEG